MAFRIDDGSVTLSGACGVEEAEDLHAALCSLDAPRFDLTAATSLHTAIVQLIIAAGGRVDGDPADPLFAACLAARPAKETGT